MFLDAYRGSDQDGGVGRNASLPHRTKRINNQSKNNKPEVPENPTAWNSDNQGVKETLTQTGRRGRDGKRAAQWRGRTARRRPRGQGGAG